MDTEQSAIKKVILDRYPTESALAKELKWPRQRLNKITTGVRLPTIDETNALAQALEMPVGDLVHIFLCRKSPNGQQLHAKS